MTSQSITRTCDLPHPDFDRAWEAIKIPEGVRTRLVAQAVLSLTVRKQAPFEVAPLHGLILLVGPPGTGKTTLARGLASRVATVLSGARTRFIQVNPHALASSSLGKSQQKVNELFEKTIPEAGIDGPVIVLLDEVETLASDRQRMSFEANPADVHRAVDAVLAGIDSLTQSGVNALLIATTNFPKAIDAAFQSRADLVESISVPEDEARRAILQDSLVNLGSVWPELKRLEADLERLVEASAGLDGRRIRKAFFAAAARSVETAQDLNRLSSEQLLSAFNDAKEHA